MTEPISTPMPEPPAEPMPEPPPESMPEPMPEPFAGSGLRYVVDGAVATITLCRPQTRNAQSPAMWAAFREIGASLPTAVRVVVIRGEGASFSSGLDRRLLAPDDVGGQSPFLGLGRLDDGCLDGLLAGYQEAFTWLRRPETITIAAVQGHAIGAGFQLALACDFRVLAEDARFAMRETSLGLVPDLGGTQPLAEAVGYARALEICVTGRWVDAEEAGHLGLATIVVPRHLLDDTVADLVAAVTSPSHRAVTATKALLQGATRRSHPDQLAAERLAQEARLRDLAAQMSHSAAETHELAPSQTSAARTPGNNEDQTVVGPPNE